MSQYLQPDVARLRKTIRHVAATTGMEPPADERELVPFVQRVYAQMFPRR